MTAEQLRQLKSQQRYAQLTAHCPCEPCPWRKTCTIECATFQRWVAGRFGERKSKQENHA